MTGLVPRGVHLVIGFLCWTTMAGCVGLRQSQQYRALSDDIAVSQRSFQTGALPDAPLTASRLAAEVLRRNPSLEAASHAAAAAAARYPQARSFEDPMLGAGTAPGTWRSQTTEPGHRIELRQSLPFPGKRLLRGEAALAQARTAVHDVENSRLQLAWTAWLLYHDYAFVLRALEINRSHTELLGELQRIARARYAAGKGSLQEPLQADVELAHLEHHRVVLESKRDILRGKINTLLHRAPELELPTLAADSGDVPAVGPGSLNELTGRALSAHPVAAARESDVAAKQAGVRLARREFFPNATVGGSYNTMWRNPQHWWMASVSINVPIQIRRRTAALAEATSELRRAEAMRKATHDQIRLEVMSAHTQLKEAHHVVQFFSKRVLPSDRASVTAARSGFEAGRNTFLALIDAQRRLLSDELGHAEALTGLRQRQGDLARSLGDLATLRDEGEKR